MKISKKDLKVIGQDLNKRQPPKLADDVAQDMTLKQVIIALAPKLLRMKRRGITTDGMVAALKDNKVSIDGKTLNRYLNDYQAARKKKTAPAATANPKTIKSADGRDGLTPREENSSRQADHEVTTKPASYDGFSAIPCL